MSLAAPTAAPPATLGRADEARAAILAALEGVAGVRAHGTIPDAPQPYDAFPRWALTNYTGGRLAGEVQAVHEYDVLVVLPAGYEPDTVAQGDVLLDKLAVALHVVGTLRQADPVQLTFQNGTVPALRLRIVPHLRTTTAQKGASHGRR